LQLPRRDDPNVDVCQLFFDWLNEDGTGQWLLLLDNADDSELFFPSTDCDQPSSNVIRTKKPLLNNIPKNLDFRRSIIVTTRHRQLGEDLSFGEPSIEILPFTAREAKTFLQSRAGGTADDRHESEAERLFEILGYIPLAISQAAAFMRRNRMSIQRYLRALEKDERNLTEHLNVELRDPRREIGIPNSIFRTWKLSFDQIQKQDPRAAALLSLSAMFDLQQIPEWLLRKENEKDVDFSSAIGTLHDLSLITKEIEEDKFSMHRLVQLSIHAWLEQHDQKVHYSEHALEILADNFS
jgi:hypothetical protein